MVSRRAGFVHVPSSFAALLTRLNPVQVVVECPFVIPLDLS